MEVGEKLRQLRKSKGMTLKDLADLFSLKGESIRLWEMNGRISAENKLKLAEIFNVPASHFNKVEDDTLLANGKMLDTFGDRLKYQRKKHGLTQQELSEKSGVSQSAISQAENNMFQQMSKENTNRLVRFFGVEDGYFEAAVAAAKKSDDFAASMNQLAEWREKGIVTEPEFKALKARLFSEHNIPVEESG